MQTTNQQPLYRFRLKDFFWLLLCVSALITVGTIPNELFFGYGSIVKAFAALLVVYWLRSVILMRDVSKRQRVFAYSAILIALLPYVYTFLNLYNPPFRLSVHKWIGDPIWVFTVPTMSFIVFDLRDQPKNLARFLIRSSVELILVFPVWTVSWIYLQFLITDFFIR